MKKLVCGEGEEGKKRERESPTHRGVLRRPGSERQLPWVGTHKHSKREARERSPPRRSDSGVATGVCSLCIWNRQVEATAGGWALLPPPLNAGGRPSPRSGSLCASVSSHSDLAHFLVTTVCPPTPLHPPPECVCARARVCVGGGWEGLRQLGLPWGGDRYFEGWGPAGRRTHPTRKFAEPLPARCLPAPPAWRPRTRPEPSRAPSDSPQPLQEVTVRAPKLC